MEFWLNLKTGTVAAAINMNPCTLSRSMFARCLYLPICPQGAATLASADGRLSGTTFADASMSAYPGTDRNGAYALFESATCWDHSRSQTHR